MNLRTALRISGAWYLLPIVFALGVWVVLSDAAGNFTGYPADDLGSAGVQLVLTGPLVSAAVAYRLPPFLALLRRSRPTRPSIAVVGTIWLPLLVGGPVVGVLAMVSASRVLPSDLMSWTVLAVVLSAGMACAAFGALAARGLPTVVAIPVAAALPFVWIAFPGARADVLPRNLNSDFGSCCGDADQPALGMILGSATLDLVVVLGAVYILGTTWWEQRSRGAATAGLLVVLAVAGGLGTAAAEAAPGHLNMLALESRRTTPTCARDGEYRACSWPENRTQLARSLRVLRDADEAFARLGLPRITSVSEKPQTPGAVLATASGRASTALVRLDLMRGYVARSWSCAERKPPNGMSPAMAVAGLIAGVAPSDLEAEGLSPRGLDEARAVTAAGRVAVARWFAAQTCAGAPGASG